jgi:hypothetical protein
VYTNVNPSPNHSPLTINGRPRAKSILLSPNLYIHISIIFSLFLIKRCLQFLRSIIRTPSPYSASLNYRGKFSDITGVNDNVNDNVNALVNHRTQKDVLLLRCLDRVLLDLETGQTNKRLIVCLRRRGSLIDSLPF